MSAAETRPETLENLLQELQASGIRDRRLLEAITKVPRHLFVPPEHRARAYANLALPLGEQQTISQPLVVAMMTQALALRGHEKILEIGTGSGYQAALLAELAAQVITLERIQPLAERARDLLLRLGYDNVEVHVGDGSLGWPSAAPYNGIIVTAAAPRIPGPLVDQLAVEGRIVIPVGNAAVQALVVATKEERRLRYYHLGPVRFVPLIGQEGWRLPSHSPN